MRRFSLIISSTKFRCSWSPTTLLVIRAGMSEVCISDTCCPSTISTDTYKVVPINKFIRWFMSIDGTFLSVKNPHWHLFTLRHLTAVIQEPLVTDLRHFTHNCGKSDWMSAVYVVTVTKLHTSRPRKDFTPLTARLQVTSTALLALLRCEFWAVFTCLGSAVRIETLQDSSVTLKHALWWRTVVHTEKRVWFLEKNLVITFKHDLVTERLLASPRRLCVIECCSMMVWTTRFTRPNIN
jgi:hypothetical protein